jgi:hypothetical protein
VNADPDPRALIAPGRIDVRERVNDYGARHQPRLVQVVAREQDRIGKPVAAAEDALHPRQQHAAEEQLFAEDVEEEEQEDEGIPAPVALHEVLARLRADPGREVAILRGGERRDEPAEREQQSQRNQQQPEAATDTAGARAAG